MSFNPRRRVYLMRHGSVTYFDAAGKTFTDSAKAHKLALTSPEAFSVYSVPEALNGANENTGLLIEAAEIGRAHV